MASRARLRQFMFKARLTTDVEFLVRRYINTIPVRLSSQGEFTPVPFGFCEFFSKILTKNIIPERVTPLRVHPGELHWVANSISVRISQQNDVEK